MTHESGAVLLSDGVGYLGQMVRQACSQRWMHHLQHGVHFLLHQNDVVVSGHDHDLAERSLGTGRILPVGLLELLLEPEPRRPGKIVLDVLQRLLVRQSSQRSSLSPVA
uniref:(northern house mosquito) hypothetical protein n=1 Tax=Culex pipiens TaxID=7175 RepID=A0A8D8NNU8_CULPI